MSVSEYAVRTDFFRFKPKEDSDDFPCCVCEFKEQSRKEYPCLYCDHNVDPEPYYNCSLCGEFQPHDPFKKSITVAPRTKAQISYVCKECSDILKRGEW